MESDAADAYFDEDFKGAVRALYASEIGKGLAFDKRTHQWRSAREAEADGDDRLKECDIELNGVPLRLSMFIEAGYDAASRSVRYSVSISLRHAPSPTWWRDGYCFREEGGVEQAEAKGLDPWPWFLRMFSELSAATVRRDKHFARLREHAELRDSVASAANASIRRRRL